MDSASSAEKPFFSSNDEMFTYFATMYELDLTKIKCPQIRDISDGEIFSVILNDYNTHKSWKKTGLTMHPTKYSISGLKRMAQTLKRVIFPMHW